MARPLQRATDGVRLPAPAIVTVVPCATAHLEYARLTLAQDGKDQARERVVEARRLVKDTGQGRRRPEVEALEAEVR
jgi:hypothetical protein